MSSWGPPSNPSTVAVQDERLQGVTRRLSELFAAADPERLRRATERQHEDIAAALGIEADELQSLVENAEGAAADLAQLHPDLRTGEQ